MALLCSYFGDGNTDAVKQEVASVSCPSQTGQCPINALIVHVKFYNLTCPVSRLTGHYFQVPSHSGWNRARRGIVRGVACYRQLISFFCDSLNTEMASGTGTVERNQALTSAGSEPS